MMGRCRSELAERSARALELHEKGLNHQTIAERLRINPRDVYGLIKRAKERRELAKVTE